MNRPPYLFFVIHFRFDDLVLDYMNWPTNLPILRERVSIFSCILMQAIAIACCFKDEGSILIVCPAVLRYSWAEELERWDPSFMPKDIHIGMRNLFFLVDVKAGFYWTCCTISSSPE